ncbi:hypothetical protein V2550_07535 [Tenacibaculum maritimum]
MGQNNSKQQNNSKDDDIKSFINEILDVFIEIQKALDKIRNK